MKLPITLFLLLGFTSISNATPPNQPSDIGFTYIDNSTVRVSFADNSDNEQGFHFYIDGSSKFIWDNDSKYVYKTLTRLSCNKTHTVSIDAYNYEGKTSKISKNFTFEGTLGKPCLPVVKVDTQNQLSITKMDLLTENYPDISPFVANFEELVSCSWKLNGSPYNGLSCQDLKEGFSYQLYPLYSLNIGENNLTLTVTDINGASATDTLSIKLIDDVSHTVYLSEHNRTIKVGQTILIDASIQRICYNGHCSSHGWGDSNLLGTFNDSMFETGHVFAGQGHTASTAYTAETEGNTTLTLYGNGGKKSINVEIIAPNRIVIDDNLMWQDNHKEIKKLWSLDALNLHDTSGDTAKTYCSNLNWANYTDWRIPKIEELIGYIGFNNDKEYWGSVEYNSYSYSKFGSIVSSSLKSLGEDEELSVKCVRDIKE